jgi:hypothetical protein
VFTAIPALTQVREVGVNRAWARVRSPFWKRRCAQECGDRGAGDPQLPGYLVSGDTLLRERYHLLKASLSRGTALLLAPLFSRGVLGGPLERIRWNQAARRLTEAGMVASETAFHNLTGIDQQVKAVGDLLRLWRAQGGAPKAAPAA